MKTKISQLVAFALLGLTATSMRAQVGINNTATNPDPSAILDLQSGNTGVNKGFLPQAVALTNVTTAAPVVTPATGLIVYSSTPPAGGSGIGYYYWTGTVWASMGNGWSLTGNAGTIVGTNFIGTTDANPLEIKVDGQKSGYIDYGSPFNTSFGYTSLASITSGRVNSAVGYGALFSNTSGSANTAGGVQTLDLNSSGSWNTALGTSALFFNTTGSSITAVGYAALYKNTVDYSTAVGDSALYSNTTGLYNTATGYQALALNSTGLDNSAFGFQALYSNTTGGINTGIGHYALYGNTTGVWNTANGADALWHNTTGSYNTASGVDALDVITTGSSNTAIGVKALYNNTANANTAAGDSALYNNTTGNYNTANGYQALSNNSTGSFNTACGYNAGPASGALTNTTAIGTGASVTTNNTIVLGNASITSLQCNVTSITALSDGRFKKDIKADVHGLDFIMKLTPVSYHLNITKLNAFKKVKNADQQSVHAAEAVMQNGFIAQDVEKAAQAINYDFPGLKTPQNESDTYGLGYTDFVMPLVKAVQEQEDTIQALKAQITALKNENKQQACSQAQINQKTSQQLANDEKDIAELKSLLIAPTQRQASASINK